MEVNESRIYVGNLPFSVGFEELKELFSQFGEITEATVVVNFYTGRSKGFGFVTFAKKESADKAISEMNGKDVKGRMLNVKPAMPMKEKEERAEETEGQEERPRRRNREEF